MLTTCIAYLVFMFQGITNPLVSVMILEIAAKYGVDTSTIGYIFTLTVVGGGAAALASGKLMEKQKASSLIFAGTAILIFAGVAIVLSNSLAIFALAMLLFGIGVWLLIAVGNFLIVSRYQGEARSSQLNILNFAYSLGALLSPAFAGFMLKNSTPWELVFVTPGIVLVLLVLLTYRLHNIPQSIQSPSSETEAAHPAVPWHIGVYLSGTALGIYCILELSYANWIVVHLRENLNVDIVGASMILTVFYICQAIGRFASGFIVKILPLGQYIIGCSVIGLITASFIIFSTNYTVILLLTILMSLGIASLYPSILSYGTQQVKIAAPSLLTFFITAGIAGGIGGMLLTSFVKQSFGVLFCIATSAVSALLIILLIGATLVLRPKAQNLRS